MGERMPHGAPGCNSAGQASLHQQNETEICQLQIIQLYGHAVALPPGESLVLDSGSSTFQ